MGRFHFSLKNDEAEVACVDLAVYLTTSIWF